MSRDTLLHLAALPFLQLHRHMSGTEKRSSPIFDGWTTLH